jgi:DNA topoisomerase IB
LLLLLLLLMPLLALVDLQVGNFRVEPPSLFRGRGEHPKMGKIKQRVYPRDITINIGEHAHNIT